MSKYVAKQLLAEAYPRNLLLTLAYKAPNPSNFPLSKTEEKTMPLLATLPEREQDALRLRFEQRKTFSEVGAEIGVSTERARYLVYLALRKLRKHLTSFL